MPGTGIVVLCVVVSFLTWIDGYMLSVELHPHLGRPRTTLETRIARNGSVVVEESKSRARGTLLPCVGFLSPARVGRVGC